MRITALQYQTADRTKAVWIVLILVLAAAVIAGGWVSGNDGGSPAFAQTQNPLPAGLPSDGHLIVLKLTETQSPQGRPQQGIVIVDPVDRVLSVYQVDLQTLAIKLQGVRRIHWDLKMSEFNGQSPLPQEIQALVEQK